MAGEKLLQKALGVLAKSAPSKVVTDPAERAANLAKAMSRSAIKNTETNEPLRLYHATTQPNLEALKAGGFDPTISGEATWLSPYADKQPAWHNTRGGDNYREGANVMPVYADIQTPLVLDTPEMIDWAQTAFAGGSREFPQYLLPKWRKALVDEGYDGIVYGGPKSKEYALHDLQIGQQPHRDEEILSLFPERQLKSAIGNGGEYDMEVPRLSEASGGSIDAALHMLRQHRAEGGFLSGPDYLSTGEAASPTNWGDPELASDFFKADRAARLAREVLAQEPARDIPLPPRRPPPVSEEDVRAAPMLARASLRVKEEEPAVPSVDEKFTARAMSGPELTERDRDLIIRTIAAETSGKSPEESQAIAHVILNRIQSGKFGASPEAVLFAKRQFEPWANPKGANYPMRFAPTSARYGMGRTALEAALVGDDITRGALNFWGPKAQAALGRKPPKWAGEMPDYTDIGETRFHRPRAEGGEVEENSFMRDDFDKGGVIKKALRAIQNYQDPAASKIADWKWRPLADVDAELGLTEIPPHVQAFGDYMRGMSDKAAGTGLTARDLIKGYTTTRASIQRRATDADRLRQLGLDLPDDVKMIRPEGAWAEWLGTPMGKRYLDAAARGDVEGDAVANAIKIMSPFGRHETDIPDSMKWAAQNLPGREATASDLVARAAQGGSSPEEWRQFTSDIRGVGPSKSGFLASLYGRGDQPTLDARQIILNTGEPTKLAAPHLARSKGEGGVEAVERLAARQAALGLEAPSKYDPFYQHLAHHSIWDKASNEMTTHGDVVKAMEEYAHGGGVNDVSQLPESAFSDLSKKMDYMPLNIGNLLNAGAIRITQPGSGTGPEPFINDDPDQWSLVTKYNDENLDNYTKQWPDKPSSYQSAADALNIKDGPLYDGKYRQILWSANQLGMKPEDIFLPSDREARAHGGESEGYDKGGKVVSKALKAVSELFDSPGMTKWREKSVIPASRVEDRYYTGTSKDKDFPNFKVEGHGAWFTKDPAEASSYAQQNDSKGYKRDGWNMVPVNTADRVIPAYLRAENPFTGPLPESVMADNYKKAQTQWFDELRALGHDAWMPEDSPNLAVILKNPSDIKSALSNSGDFDLNSPRIDRAEGGGVEEYGDGGIIKKALQAVGGAFKPTETGWIFKDVRNPNLTPAQNRAISHAIDAGRYVEAELPIRSIYATQPHVNADFASPVSSNRGNLPVVQRIGDEFYVRDGHHRLTKLATEGAETAKVYLVDPWERTPTEMPLLDWKPKTPEQVASERALAQRQKQENDDLYNDLMSLGFGDIEPQGRAEGGEVEDALAVVRRHYATDGYVSSTQRLRDVIASIDPEASRDQPVMDPEKMGEAWDRARRNYQNFPVQEGEAVARPLDLSARDVIGGAIAGEARAPGADFRRGVADLLVGSKGLPDSGTLGFGVADAPMLTGIPLTLADMAHDVGQGDYGTAAASAALPAALYARGPLGAAGRRAVEIAKEYAKPAAATAAGVAGATLAPDEAEAAKLSKLLRVVSPEDRLMMVHNLRSHRLADVEKLGGLPVPSTAIVKPSQGFTNFGDITMVAPKEMAQPSRTNPIFGADVYSPRFPATDDAGERIFKGFTPSGTRRYAPLTLENAVKEMKGNIRGGEGFDYGAGTIRAGVAPQFKSIKEIQNARDLIKPREEMQGAFDLANEKLNALAEKYYPHYNYGGDQWSHMKDFSDMLREAGMGKWGELRKTYKSSLPPELYGETTDFLNYLKGLPTEYFEGKPQRAVRLNEFRGAVVPGDIAGEQADILRRMGVERLEQYDPNSAASRIEALQKFEGEQFRYGGSIEDRALEISRKG